MNYEMNEIYLRRKNKVVLEAGFADLLSKPSPIQIKTIATFLKNIESLGYTVSGELLEVMFTLNRSQLDEFYSQTVETLKVMVGANVKYEPMYPNFPHQVMEASDAELYLNAIMHYIGVAFGARIMPSYTKENRAPLADDVKLTIINLGSTDDFDTIFTNLVASNTSLSDYDKDCVKWFITKCTQRKINSILPDSVPLRENVAFIASLVIDTYGQNCKIWESFKTATDVLRFAVCLSDGDMSLAEPCKFKKFNRPTRRMIMDLLQHKCKAITEDMLRYREQWKRLGERIHPFEKNGWRKYPKTCEAFEAIYNKAVKFETFNAKVERHLEYREVLEAVNLLKSRPGEFARRLDHVLRLCTNSKLKISVLLAFKSVVHEVSTPVLLQVMAHFLSRNNASDTRIFFPKGQLAKAKVIPNKREEIAFTACLDVVTTIQEILIERFSELDSLGKVYLDRSVEGFLVPMSQRSASTGLRSVPRGSKYELSGDKNTVRFFIHWKNMQKPRKRVDVDLSAVFLKEDFSLHSQVSYTNLRDYGCYHSGDITSAPNGAAEFIDVDIEKCLARGARYAVMNVYSYTWQPFNEIPECYAGAMLRESPKSGEIFEPSTVDNRIDLTAETTTSIPMIIDLVERKVIWTDLALKSNPRWSNNLHGNTRSLSTTVQGIVEMTKPDLYDLFWLHVNGRGEFVDDIADADTVISLDIDPDDYDEMNPPRFISPFDSDIIVSEFMS